MAALLDEYTQIDGGRNTPDVSRTRTSSGGRPFSSRSHARRYSPRSSSTDASSTAALELCFGRDQDMLLQRLLRGMYSTVSPTLFSQLRVTVLRVIVAPTGPGRQNADEKKKNYEGCTQNCFDRDTLNMKHFFRRKTI